MKLSKRIDDAANAAALKFWESIAQAFPEATSGDFGPEETADIESAMSEAVATWVFHNVQDKILGGAIEILNQRGHVAHYDYPGFISVAGWGFGWDGQDFNGNSIGAGDGNLPAIWWINGVPEVNPEVSTALEVADAIEAFLRKETNVSST